jgi:hypothetical protein
MRPELIDRDRVKSIGNVAAPLSPSWSPGFLIYKSPGFLVRKSIAASAGRRPGDDRLFVESDSPRRIKKPTEKVRSVFIRIITLEA